jgi:hypothetical protein
MILNVVCVQPARFNEIKRRLDGITHKRREASRRGSGRSGHASNEANTSRSIIAPTSAGSRCGSS